MRIDHVIYATADLHAAAARLEAEHGLAAKGGGRHDGIGTVNRTIPLGGGYLELLAIADPAEAEASPFGRAVAERIRTRGEGLMAWAVSVEDARAAAARTGGELSTIGRQGLFATLAGLSVAMAEPYLPFFIERDPASADPSLGGPHGGIRWIEVTGDALRLQEWLGGAELPVRIAAGAPAVRAVGIGEQLVLD